MSKQVIALFLFLMAGTLLAHAGRIEISEPPCQQGDIFLGPEDLGGFTFAPIDGGGEFKYCNQTGEDWTNLTIAIRTSTPASSIICPSASPNDPFNNAGLAFSACQVIPSGPEEGIIYVRLFGTISPNPIFEGDNGFPGVPNNSEFTINLFCDDSEDCTPWTPDTIFVAAADNRLPHVPEPASLALLGSGLAAGLFRRKVKA